MAKNVSEGHPIPASRWASASIGKSGVQVTWKLGERSGLSSRGSCLDDGYSEVVLDALARTTLEGAEGRRSCLTA
jgi:hypothetical protein